MKSYLVAQILGALLVAKCAFGAELVASNGGLTSGYGAGGMTISTNDCTQCVRDGDLNTSWDVTASSLLTVDGDMDASVQPFFLHPAHVDTVSLKVLFEVSNTAGSTRINQGSYELQYRQPGPTYVTLLTDSFGPAGGNSPVSISYNGTVSGLDLNNVDALRLVASASTTMGSGKATFHLHVYEISATGTLVPEPSAGGLLVLGIAGVCARWRRGRCR